MTTRPVRAGGAPHWAVRGISLSVTAAVLVYALLVLAGRVRGAPIGGRSLVLYWPTLVSAVLLFSFGRTLLSPPPMVERFARLQKPLLSAEEIFYCRKVTQVWCAFFLANGLTALGLALVGALKAWALYTGLISYLLIGTLFAAEFLYRHWRFRPGSSSL